MKADFYLDQYGDQIGEQAWLFEYATHYHDFGYHAWLFSLRDTQVAVYAENLTEAIQVIDNWIDNTDRGYLIGITQEFIKKWHRAIVQADFGPDPDDLVFVNLGRPIIVIEGDCK